eukprot:CAMPEP_0117552746 /NCGR_PEP_ID=MMETSP0784-20121206/49867_1 /TAXON_ID=39447 /ORGANISM="" /LENGTH=231 /DNA_ID=CAMNT_0005349829 /DNA_START=81 /DNA_END=776 /DNA_ORIENTATION=-
MALKTLETRRIRTRKTVSSNSVSSSISSSSGSAPSPRSFAAAASNTLPASRFEAVSFSDIMGSPPRRITRCSSDFWKVFIAALVMVILLLLDVAFLASAFSENAAIPKELSKANVRTVNRRSSQRSIGKTLLMLSLAVLSGGIVNLHSPMLHAAHPQHLRRRAVGSVLRFILANKRLAATPRKLHDEVEEQPGPPTDSRARLQLLLRLAVGSDLAVTGVQNAPDEHPADII